MPPAQRSQGAQAGGSQGSRREGAAQRGGWGPVPPCGSLNLSDFVARHIWRRRGVSPRRGRAYRRQRRAPLRGFLGLMATIFDLRQTAIN